MLFASMEAPGEIPSVDVPPIWGAAFTVLGITVLWASVKIWAIAWQQSQQRQPFIDSRFFLRPPRVPLFAVIVALNWIGLILLSKMLPQPTNPVVNLEGVIRDNLVVTALIAFLVWTGVRDRRWLIRLGFRMDGLSNQFRYGVLGFVAALVPVYVCRILTSPYQSEEVMHPLLKVVQEPSFGLELFQVGLLAVILAPIQEELVFRVILQSWLERFLSPVAAVVVSASLFAAVHGFPDAVGLMPLALILGYVYQRRRSYLAVVVLHACFNAFNLLLALAMSAAGLDAPS
ncbi:MAG: CPBP family intramembrane metalloprotease [Planctomycetaceae bacterium]|nr:CPBP family intramembrane metalloprotease [Planctomycetaceae bacterium]